MAVSSELLKSYAAQFLPVFRFADTERVFPVDAESWLRQCADGDWDKSDDPHRGTTIVEATLPLSLAGLFASGGCRGVGASGPVGAPIDPTHQLPAPDSAADDLFIDFAGWSSLSTGDGFVSGDDDYIRGYFEPYFAQFNSFLTQGVTRPTTRTKPTLPTDMVVYCEAAWAGDFTRRSIATDSYDFATATTDDPDNPQPDPALDRFLVLTYYLFYPCTEPPPPNPDLSPGSPNLNYREGQWEAVSFYFAAAEPGAVVQSAADLTLPDEPDGVTPAYAVLSQGITESGDGRSPQLSNCYPAAVGSWPTGGLATLSGGFPSYAKELVPASVFVTSGTHKNKFGAPYLEVPDPDQTGLAVGAAFEGAGGLVAGVTGGTGVGLVLGFLLWLIGLIISVVAANEKDTIPTPDPDGDMATDTGPAAGSADSAEATPGAPSSFVSTDLRVYSTLPDTDDLRPPPWWTFPGRWGVAISSEVVSSWDSGGRRYDFKDRSRAYWNTVALQYQAPGL